MSARAKNRNLPDAPCPSSGGARAFSRPVDAGGADLGVGDEDEIAGAGIARDIPASFADMCNVMGFMANPPGYGNQVDGETLVDQKSHDTAIAASRRRDRCTGR